MIAGRRSGRGWGSALVASAAMLFALSACSSGSKASNPPAASAATDGASPEPDAGGFFAAPPDASSPSPCADAGDLFVEVTGDGPVQTYQAGCAYSTVPYGGSQFVGGEGSSAQQSVVTGCAPPSTLTIASWLLDAGDTDAATLMYDDRDGGTWRGSGTLHIARWSPVGSALEGSYSGLVAALADGGPSLGLSGSFRVCHAYDGPPAP
jgi:hypothetical protein